MNANQKQIMYFIYDLRNTPERGVGPDPRLTENGLSDGTGLALPVVKTEVIALKNKAFIRTPPIGKYVYHYLTPEGLSEVEKLQKKTVKLGFSGNGFNAAFEKTEEKGGKPRGVD